MDKILITAFKSEVAAAILNSQNTNKNLNPHADAYIDEEELPAVLEFFGKKDVNELLANPNESLSESVFNENKDSDEEPVNSDKFSSLVSPDKAVLHKDGSAAYELQNKIAKDLVLTSATGTPFAAQMDNLYETRKALLKKHQDTTDVDAKITALNEAVEEYIKNNRTDVIQNLIDNDFVKTFKYGDNGEKTGYFVQTFNFKGGNTMKKGSDNTESSGGDSSESQIVDASEEGSSDGNQTGVNVKYGVEVVTDKLHAIGNVEAGSDNVDVQGVVVYNNPLKDGSNLSFSGNLRYSGAKDDSETDIGASVDYTKRKFSTGAYASYKASTVESVTDKEFNAEAYVKYGNSIRLGAGHEYESTNDGAYNYNFLKAKFGGSRNISNNLSISGTVEGAYGVTKTDDNTCQDYEIIARGGVAFKSNKLKANVFATAAYNVSKNVFEDGSDARTISGTLVGNISTDKVDVTATVSGTNSPTILVDAESYDFVGIKNEWGYSSSVTVTPKKILGKDSKIVPSVTYNLSSNNKHYVGMNLGINL